MIATIEAGRGKQAKLMKDVILHLDSGDQAKFNRSLLVALKHWEKSQVKDVPNLIHWVSLPLSVIRLWALQRGMVVDELPSHLDALLVR